MGILSRTGDLVYTIRFLRLLTTKWEDTGAFKLGIVDNEGKKIKKPSTEEERSAYNTFHRLVFSVKRLINKAPGGKSSVASYAAALFLIKEELNLGVGSVEKIAEELPLDALGGLNEDVAWFRAEDGMLSPGTYRIDSTKISTTTFEEITKRGDKVRVEMNSYPIDNVLGQDIFEATHIPTGQTIYVATGELRR
jgi:hypothetical protein